MTRRNGLDMYVDLINRSFDRALPAPEFERAFLPVMKSERRILCEPASPILEVLFEAVGADVGDLTLRTGPEDFDEVQLRAWVRRARQGRSDSDVGS